jgi:hypothetical protein
MRLATQSSMTLQVNPKTPSTATHIQGSLVLSLWHCRKRMEQRWVEL